MSEHLAPPAGSRSSQWFAFCRERGLWLALGVAALLRLPAFALAVEHYGDAPVRIELAERWAASPHLFQGFADTYQYGPLHLALLGSALRLWPDRFHAPRATSLVAGLGVVAAIFWLTSRVRGPRAATVAGLGVAAGTLFIQASTSAASEMPFLALLLWAVGLVLSARTKPWRGSAWRVALAALLLACAGLIRYDGWIYVALLAGLLLLPLPGQAPKRWAGRLASAALLALLSGLPLLGWFWLNQQATGDALAPLHFIERDHQYLADLAVRMLGRTNYRLYCLAYWPAEILLLCSPALGFAALAGAARALWKRSAGWELAALAWLPVAFFTLRGSVLLNFRPLARFVLVACALSLPFAAGAIDRAASLFPPRLRALPAASCALLALLVPLALFGASYHRDGTAAEWARPLAPVSSVPPGIEAAGLWLSRHAGPQDVVLLDGVWDYLDIPVEFLAHLPEEQLVRRSWPGFGDRVRRKQPTLAVLIQDGDLQRTPGLDGAVLGTPSFSVLGRRFCLEQQFSLAGVYRVCR